MMFESDLSKFGRKTKKRVFNEVIFLALIVSVLVSSYSSIIPNWIKILIVSTVLIYIVVGVAMYPKARKVATSYQANLTNEKVIFTIMGMSKEISFKKIDRVDAVPSEDKVSEIRLLLKDGSIVNMVNLENMDVLYEKLLSGLKR